MSEKIERDYVDIYSIKNMAVNNIMPTYFPDVEASNLTTGVIGMITELVGTITEDSFNTGSSLVAEAFPTRAKMMSSIYSNAAIFQLSNAFANASTCEIILGIPEEDIRNNFSRKENSDYYYFYIDKDTTIDVEGIPFTLDYDIEIRSMYRESDKGWIYSAKYIMDESVNSISPLKDPYIRLKKMKNGLVILYLTARQYERTVIYESIVDNTTLNYPTIKIKYDDKLLGFDVFYKAPSDDDYNTQLETKVIYSLPSKAPFCYFKSVDDQTIELSFTTKDTYFQPDFNSELEIVVYTTKGDDGNFDGYDGKEINITKGDKYEYVMSWLLTGRILSSATGGRDRLSTEGLRALTVEGYSTANALTTEHDLQVYFSNFKYRYREGILFMKKRNDAVELLFSAFMYIKKDDYIYPTNTLTLDTSVLELEYKDGGFYNLDPGYLFGYKKTDAFFIPVYYKVPGGDGEYYDKDGHYYDALGIADPARDIAPEKIQRMLIQGSLYATDASYWRLAGDDTDTWKLYSSDGAEIEEAGTYTTDEMYAVYQSGAVEYGVHDLGTRTIDFIRDQKKEIQAKIDYMNYFEAYKELNETPDMTYSEYLFNYNFKQYKKEHGIDNRINVLTTDFENFEYMEDFMFTNPFIMTIMKDTGLISYYQTFISQDSILEFVKENDDDAFTQFITYTLHVDRDVSKEKKYNITIKVTPSITQTDEYPYCPYIYDENDESQFILYEGSEPSLSNFDRTKLSKNRLRMVLSFYSEAVEIGYYELVPTAYDPDSDQYTFSGEIYTDDYISSDNRFRIVHKCPHCGSMILNSANYTNENRMYFCDKCQNYFNDGLVNILESDTILLPIDGLIVTLSSVFRDPVRDEKPVTNNDYERYDETFKDYIWTNSYSTSNDPLVMIQPLDMIRSNISYKDYFVTGVDALDCTISSIPLLKYSILAYKDSGMSITDPLLSDDIGKFQYFMDSFLENYDILRQAKEYLGGMNIDAKLYNSYGRSTNFLIGTDNELIDTINIALHFDVYLNAGADILDVDKKLKNFIKDYVETINSDGTNNLYISNLIRELEKNFSEVNHLRFRGINNYDTTYQSIINYMIDLKGLTKEQRMNFVPDILVINKNNIYLEYYQDEV